MFDITAKDIALLNDTDLRELIALLCAAELRRRNFSPSYVNWSGNQNAQDGGIDVEVALPIGSVIDGFIPRANTAFQVKCQDIPPKSITSEMRPNGDLRPSIIDLIQQSGAYVIVSSKASTSKTFLKRRQDAMSAAIEGTLNVDSLKVDFFDGGKIADWVRNHPGILPWVRERIGRPIQGWRSHGRWAFDRGIKSSGYLADDKIRIRSSSFNSNDGITALDGIHHMRKRLGKERQILRLVGLSGVGKTRLVQALFEEQIGEGSLDPALVAYADMEDEPSPSPVNLARSLIACGLPAILVIDNCQAGLHNRLSEVCRSSDSKLSLISIELDVRSDEPEGTEVYKLEPSSEGLTEKFVLQTFPLVSPIDARRIAVFSGGNSRIAAALASKVTRGEMIASLNDEELFQRLFVQKNQTDERLYLAAQVCSLVYSFRGDDTSAGDESHLARLGELCKITPSEMFRFVAELKSRDLVQGRSNWRAVLPDGIANQLATVALQRISARDIEEQFWKDPSGHLIRSFSHRLGYLHGVEEAVAIARQWLGADGILKNYSQLNPLGIAIFEKVAPACPSDILANLERGLEQADEPEKLASFRNALGLLRSIAFDADLFDRCIRAMVQILEAVDCDERPQELRLFVSLFQRYFSGTHADICQRLKIIRSLLDSNEPRMSCLGVEALKAVIHVGSFHGEFNFEFGARSRNYGYWPSTMDEIKAWFEPALQLVEAVASGVGPNAAKIKEELAGNFHGLWHGSNCKEALAEMFISIQRENFWPEGWFAVRQAVELDAGDTELERHTKLKQLESQMRPNGLLQQVRSVVFLRPWDAFNFETPRTIHSDDISADLAETDFLAKKIGTALMRANVNLFAEILPELVTKEGRLHALGQGLYEGSPNVEETWSQLVQALFEASANERKPMVLKGFLKAVAEKDPVKCGTFLEHALNHEVLAEYYPFFAVELQIDAAGVDRFMRSITQGRTRAGMYIYLAYIEPLDSISARDLKKLLLEIAKMPSGHETASRILTSWLHSYEKENRTIEAELVDAGCELIRRVDFNQHRHNEGYYLGEIAGFCLRGPEGVSVVKVLCRNLKTAISNWEASASNYVRLLEGLFLAQPKIMLDSLCGETSEDLASGIAILGDALFRKQLLDLVPEELLIEWCDVTPEARYPAISGVVPIAHRASNTGPMKWTSIALRFLECSPDPAGILNKFVSHLMPSFGWTGEVETQLVDAIQLLDALEIKYPALAPAIAQEKERLKRTQQHQKGDAQSSWGRDERFES
jgi:hypothetical protein